MKLVLIHTLFFVSVFGFSQNKLQKLLNKFNDHSVAYVSADTLQISNYLLLDARELEEYQVSHIKNAKYVGYNEFNLRTTTNSIPNKKTPIVVYCSLGIRSEIIAKQLKAAGYTNIYNLYGGIFEWKNNNKTVVNLTQQKNR